MPPQLVALAKPWLQQGAFHVATRGPGKAPRTVVQYRGLDRGRSLSPAFYAIAARDVMARVEEVMERVDPRGRALASGRRILGRQHARGAPGRSCPGGGAGDDGLTLHPEKMRVWAPDGKPATAGVLDGKPRTTAMTSGGD